MIVCETARGGVGKWMSAFKSKPVRGTSTHTAFSGVVVVDRLGQSSARKCRDVTFG
jgi:hypothetical protein